MKVLLLSDTYPPRRTSGAVLLQHLAKSLVSNGVKVTVAVPAEELSGGFDLQQEEGVQVLRVATWRTKDVGYLKRTFAEVSLSSLLCKGLTKSGLGISDWGAVLWYSPTIFLGPLARKVARRSNCPAYLILRDIFPDWAVDVGLLSRGPVYRFFKYFERLQYQAATRIGIQSTANFAYFDLYGAAIKDKVELLENWLGAPKPAALPTVLADLKHRQDFVVVYTGNMGVAQGLQPIFAAIAALPACKRIRFLFIGRGSEKKQLMAFCSQRQLSNVTFHDEISPDEVHEVLCHCDLGLVALDTRHHTHNVPGKFVAYLQAGLPVLAKVNPGNDLEYLINETNVGEVYTQEDSKTLVNSILHLRDNPDRLKVMSRQALELFRSRYQVGIAADRILAAIGAKQG